MEPGRPVPGVVAGLLADHPDGPGVVDEAVRLVEEVIAFTLAHGLVPDVDGECRVGPAPPSRRWAMAMISPSAPFEDDAPSWYYITPPEPSWPIEQQQEWLSVFSATTLPAITVHEVAPGHFAHFRGLRRIQRRGPAGLAVERLHRRMGPLRRGALPRRRVSGQRSPLRRRGRPRSSRPGDPTGRRHRHPHRLHVDGRSRPPLRGRRLSSPGRRPAPRPPGPPSIPATAATPGASSRSAPFGTRPRPSGDCAIRTAGSTRPLLEQGAPPLGLMGTTLGE